MMPSPASESTTPLLIVLNTKAGKKDAAANRTIIEKILIQAGRPYKLFVVEDVGLLEEMARLAVDEAVATGGAVVAAGGDSTISAVARAAFGSGCAFGVLPQGTFNYFGRAHGIPENMAEAVRALMAARIQPVQVGLVNDRVFLVNASLGLHSHIVEDRKTYTRQYGRSRLVAFWGGFMTLLHHHRKLCISIEYQGKIREMCALTLFVCNNSLQLERIGIPLSHNLERGQLAAFMLRPVGTWTLLWLLVRGALGKLGDADNVISFAFDNIKVRLPGFYGRRRIKVAIDGEIAELGLPLDFRVAPDPLYLLKPPYEAVRNDIASAAVIA